MILINPIDLDTFYMMRAGEGGGGARAAAGRVAATMEVAVRREGGGCEGGGEGGAEGVSGESSSSQLGRSCPLRPTKVATAT